MSDETKVSRDQRSIYDFRLMQQFYDDAVKPLDKKPCAGIRDDLKCCILASSCVAEHNKSPRDCLKLKSNDPMCPTECLALRQTFFDCKRSLLDARQRFRGRKGY